MAVAWRAWGESSGGGIGARARAPNGVVGGGAAGGKLRAKIVGDGIRGDAAAAAVCAPGGPTGAGVGGVGVEGFDRPAAVGCGYGRNDEAAGRGTAEKLRRRSVGVRRLAPRSTPEDTRWLGDGVVGAFVPGDEVDGDEDDTAAAATRLT